MSTCTDETQAPEEPELPTIAVAVYRGGEVVFILDVEGGAFAPDAAGDRAMVAVLLAQAAMTLAALPPIEPESAGERALRVLQTLDGIGTPEAEAAIAALGDAAEIHTAALEMATAAIQAAAPTAH